MKTLLDFEGAGTLVANTKKLVTDAIAAHNSDLNSHGGAGSIDLDTLTDTFVTKVSGKDLSTNDFTNEYKSAIDGMSSTYAKKSDIAQVMRYYIGTTPPTDTTVIWLEPIS